ncbi:hypothetical protein M0804_006208 [Polistes exclamans]|nr:hypothetical protein M0804_006208 [Polistes exclamans]
MKPTYDCGSKPERDKCLEKEELEEEEEAEDKEKDKEEEEDIYFVNSFTIKDWILFRRVSLSTVATALVVMEVEMKMEEEEDEEEEVEEVVVMAAAQLLGHVDVVSHYLSVHDYPESLPKELSR